MNNFWSKHFYCHTSVYVRRDGWQLSLCFGCRGFLWLFRIWICVPSPPRVIVMEICGCTCVPFWCPVWVCMCPSFPQMWKTLFVHHFRTQRGRLYKIPACWSNGTVGKATIVVLTMKRLSSMALREKCTQFVFCVSRFLTLAVTFPSPCRYILPLCPLSLVPTSTRCYAAFFSSSNFLSLPLILSSLFLTSVPTR